MTAPLETTDNSTSLLKNLYLDVHIVLCACLVFGYLVAAAIANSFESIVNAVKFHHTPHLLSAQE